MSAAATAAGYLYASGRLRGRNKDGSEHEAREAPSERPAIRRKPVRVAALPPEAPPYEPRPAPAPKKVRVEYRTRRWRPDAG
ncbi:MAG: hypothetical protein JO035_07525 [Betaproteobacteria bacterium]|nr:hypothetical protein [Betaproteobacteria bacterium]